MQQKTSAASCSLRVDSPFDVEWTNQAAKTFLSRSEQQKTNKNDWRGDRKGSLTGKSSRLKPWSKVENFQTEKLANRYPLDGRRLQLIISLRCSSRFHETCFYLHSRSRDDSKGSNS